MEEQMGDDDYHYDDQESLSPAVFKLSGVDTSLAEFVLEDALSKILSCQATLLEMDEIGEILFCCHLEEEEEEQEKSNRKKSDQDTQVLEILGKYIQQQQEMKSSSSLKSILTAPTTASVSIVNEDDEDECVEYITEEKAYRLWLEQNNINNNDGNDSDDDANNISNRVSSPDGALVKPKHYMRNTKSEEGCVKNTATAKQLERDSGLFEFDNVERVHYSEILDHLLSSSKQQQDGSDKNTNWKKDFGSHPIVINGLDSSKELVAFSKCLRDTIQKHGTNTIVRTGNRETLVANGFHDSKPATLSEAVDVDETDSQQHDGTIVFNPIHEMPPAFRSATVLGRWIHPPQDCDRNRMFPNRLWTSILGEEAEARDPPRFTLCIANEGFGIGMHKHGPALFFLTEGTKKWYLNHPDAIDERLEKQRRGNALAGSLTHPAFYRELSSHKCVQTPGELLLVPNLWYHEIYNLASPTIGIQALADELPIPGTLVCSRPQSENKLAATQQ